MTPRDERTLKLTKEDVLRYLRYDAETGYFTVISIGACPANKYLLGRTAGHVRKCDNYRTIHVAGVKVFAHRLVWFLHYGTWPSCDIDHKDQNKDNNRISNLRLLDRSANRQNCGIPKTNTTGFKGTSFDKRCGKWRAYISVRAKKHFLGHFDTVEEAGSAYKTALNVHFPEIAA